MSELAIETHALSKQFGPLAALNRVNMQARVP